MVDSFSRVGDATRREVSVGKQIWSVTKQKISVENAHYHWNKHGKDFPNLQNAKQYVEQAWEFSRTSQNGIFSKARSNGELLRYNQETNTFGSFSRDGIPKTMFNPKNGIKY
jgi:pyocin large subunit-like protein